MESEMMWNTAREYIYSVVAKHQISTLVIKVLPADTILSQLHSPPILTNCFPKSSLSNNLPGIKTQSSNTYWHDAFVNCNWVDTRWTVVQYTFTHKQYTEQHNETGYTEQNMYDNKNT